MAPLLSMHQVSKGFGGQSLFKDLSIGIHPQQRVAILGPNGTGKSTLLRLMAGIETPDQGDIAQRNQLRLAYVAQEEDFAKEHTALQVATAILTEKKVAQPDVQASIALSMVGFADLEQQVKDLSGGWLKRLNLAIALAQDPELLILDEPTNHLDWEGLFNLEGQLKTFHQTLVVVSHDREFLKNNCRSFIEINPMYEKGFLQVDGTYDQYLERREAYQLELSKKRSSMANKAARELEWLRAGVKARTTKSQSRAKEAHELFAKLENVKSRDQIAKQKVNIEIEAGGKRSKKLVECKKMSVGYGDNKLIEDLDLLLGPKQCLGLLGKNASGKTSLLKVIAEEIQPLSGTLFKAEGLQTVYFEQRRHHLNPAENLLEFLGDGSDYVQFRGRSVHVASYASGFMFPAEKLHQPIGKLSGGERARLLIARLLLSPADLLILDEPTNDLDTETIDILEESITSFPGLVIVVSHDRHFLRQTCNRFLAVDGKGGWTPYADVDQWLKNLNSGSTRKTKKHKASKESSQNKVKLSYKDKRRLENIETEIQEAEDSLEKAKTTLSEWTDFSDHKKVQELTMALQQAEATVEEVYQAWSDLEAKRGN